MIGRMQAAAREISRNVQEAASDTENVTRNISALSRGAAATMASAASIEQAAKSLGEESTQLRGAMTGFLDGTERLRA